MVSRGRPSATKTAVVAVSLLAAAACGGGSGGGGGKVTAVKGEACGYLVNVGLFGGPQQLRGCGQKGATPTMPSYSPSVALPPAGSPTPITANDPDGAAAQYGPAVIFGGQWPDSAAATPPSGPISTRTEGTPATGVTSSVDIGLHPTPVQVTCYTGFKAPCTVPGGFGPFPVDGEELHVTCKASSKGTTGSATFKKATLSTSTDAGGEPKDQEPVPDNPPPNYTRSGVITNVGDVFTAVYNEQIVNADGSLTVNAVHMYLFGPTAVGEVVKGQVTCGTTPSKVSRKDTTPPSCGPLIVEPKAPDNPTPRVPRTELVGVFDAGGLQKVSNIKVENGKVDVGNPTGAPYLHLKPGQTGPLAITAERSPEAEKGNLPLTWTFDVTDTAGNTLHCPTTRAKEGPPAPETSTTSASGSPTSAGAAGAATTSAAGGAATTTSQAGGATTTSTTAPGATTTVLRYGRTPSTT